MDAKDFGIFLARTRKVRGLTQAHLAEELHVTDKAVSRASIGIPFALPCSFSAFCWRFTESLLVRGLLQSIGTFLTAIFRQMAG